MKDIIYEMKMPAILDQLIHVLYGVFLRVK